MRRRARNLLIGGAALAAIGALVLAFDPRAPDGRVLDPLWRTSEVLDRSYGDDVSTARLLDAAVIALAQETGWQLDELAIQAAHDESEAPSEVPDGYEPLWHAWQVAASGVPVREAPELVGAAIRGMVSATGDPQALVVAGDYSDQDEYFADEQSGIGALVQQLDGLLVIDQPFPGGPAARAGALPGDVLLAVDDRTMTGLDVAQAADMLRGDPGTEVVVLVEREGTGEVEITIVRDELPLTDAGVQYLEGDIGYLHVTRFAADTPELVEEHLAGLLARGARALILDLRGTSGGRQSSAALVVEQFLNGGLAYTALDLDGGLTEVQVRPGGLATIQPMVLIVDGRTAGPAEMSAASLRDNGRAVILGMPTAGDTDMHRPYQVSDDLAVVARAGRWFAPSGPTDAGVQPDAAVPLLDDDIASGYDRQMSAAYTLLWTALGGAIEPG